MMGYSLEYFTEQFDKAYREAVRANANGDYDVARVKFTEAAALLEKMATLDLANRETCLARAEKMKKIADAMSARAPEGRRAPVPGGVMQRTSYAPPTDFSGEDMSAFYSFYAAGELTDGFDKVIGLEEAKEAVTEYVINPIRYPDAYNYQFLSSKCILLEGPPGTGKTTFAKAVAKEIEQPFALVNVASLVNCYVGETGKTIDRVFESLRDFVFRNQCGVTVFFDEFDEIAKSRGGDDKASQTAVPALLRNLDGIRENENFLVIANTNCAAALDAGILSRFRRKIYIPLPDAVMRKRFFSDKLSQLEKEYFDALKLDELVAASDGLSGRAISQICDDFLHFVGGVKAGIRRCDDLNGALLAIIGTH